MRPVLLRQLKIVSNKMPSKAVEIKLSEEGNVMQTVNDIRRAFLDFFANDGHDIRPSASLVPHNDPTLMFVNAGMVPFKHVFSGAEKLHDAKGGAVIRAVSSQKCVRAGGKHNDLDNVGYTARHHTFFEMLGNFSFGDYFKKDAIALAWKFLTNELKIPEEKLYITVYHTDDEAFELWKDATNFPDEKILRIPTKDNFWSMGDTGPCGPCSEIFYDHGEGVEGEWALDSNNEDLFGDRFIEIWNLVFMQYETLANGERIDLPKPCIDTGMGLERMAAVLQHQHNNYDIDLFRKLITASQEKSGNSDPDLISSHRVIADHLRSCSFLLADGVMPSNEGRGYVLRRIMRRAMRHAHILGCKEPLMHRLVSALVAEMGEAYPELRRAEALIEQTLEMEEKRFKTTLGRGLALLDEAIIDMGHGDVLDGATVFKLYDTFGFPADLTGDILRGRGMQVDQVGFDKAMAHQKAQARAAWSGSGDATTSDLWFALEEEFGATEFLGYKSLLSSGEVIALIVDGKQVESVDADTEVQVLTNQTPFYGESGGQAGDQGVIRKKNTLLNVIDTKKQVGVLHVHVAKVTEGKIAVGDEVEMEVTGARRNALQANHTATHLLHAALRNRLGAHVTQKGSLVESGYFRFDFSHTQALTNDDIVSLEDDVNEAIRQNTEVRTRLMTPDEAIEEGAMALFGEKYGDEVRVVSMGDQSSLRLVSNLDSQSAKESKDVSLSPESYSVELCGGTHVKRIGDIGLFKITRESAVAAGIRRIEGVTASGALTYVNEKEKLLEQASGKIKATAEELPNRIDALLEERKKLERELSDLRKKVAMGSSSSGNDNGQESIGDITFVGKVVENVPAKDLRGLVDELKKQLKSSAVIVIIASNDGKVAVVAGITGDLTDRYSAVDLVRAGSESLGGKGGGGRPDFAQAGGVNFDQASNAIDAVKALLNK